MSFRTCYFDSVDVIKDAGALKEDCTSLTLASLDKCFYFWLESFLIQSPCDPVPPHGADYLFLSSKMQSALTSSPVHEDISGLKDINSSTYSPALVVQTDFEKLLKDKLQPAEQDDCGLINVWIPNDVVSRSPP